MAMVSIGGAALPNTSDGGYAVMLSDMDSENTTRNTNGVLIRDRVRSGVYKLALGWDCLTWAQLRQITAAIEPAKFSVTFFDPYTASDQTCSMYAGDRNATLIRHLSESNRGQSIWALTVDLVEY